MEAARGVRHSVMTVFGQGREFGFVFPVRFPGKIRFGFIALASKMGSFRVFACERLHQGMARLFLFPHL